MLVKRKRFFSRGWGFWILLFSFLSFLMSSLVCPAAGWAADDSMITHGFYTYGSEKELGAASRLDSVALTWGRLARNWEGKIVFTTSPERIGPLDGYPEHSLPPQPVPNLNEIKALPGEKYLMVFVMDDNPWDDQSILVELLNLDEKRLLEQVIDPMVSYLSNNPAGISFDGLVMDLEGLKDTLPGDSLASRYGKQNSGLRDKYTNFLRLLDQKLGSRKLMVCLQPNFYFDGYDFSAIGKLADLTVLMAHDFQHYSPQSAQPDITASAPYYLVKESIERALSAGLPPQKTLLAVCLAGVKWTFNGSGWQSANLSLQQIDNIVSGRNGEVLSVVPPSRYLHYYQWEGNNYDYRTGFVNVRYRPNNGEMVNAYIYYENRQSLEEKQALARSMQLKGISVWRLGLGNQEAWDTLIGNYFFVDLKGHWARGTVEELAERGVVKGTGSGRFSPEARITRAEFAAMLNRGLRLPAADQKPAFKDVRASDWFYEDVSRVYGAGIVQGKSADQFKPQDPITREEAACMLVRALGYKGVQLPKAGEPDFIDRRKVSSWAVPEVSRAAGSGLVVGQPTASGMEFKPRAYTTRAEGAVMIKRLLDRI